MVKQISVCNLPGTTTESEIQKLFAPYGKVVKVQIKWIGKVQTAYVDMISDAQADMALKGLANAKMGTNILNVNEARPDKSDFVVLFVMHETRVTSGNASKVS